MHLQRRLASTSLFVLIAACSGGGGNSGGGPADAPPSPPPVTGTLVTVTFPGALPNAAAIAPTGGVFTASTLSRNTLTFLVPAGTNAYAFAVACPAANLLVAEYVYEANLSDGTSYSVNPCSAPAAATGSATGSFDISAIAGAVKARIEGAAGFSGDVNGTIGTFNVSMPAGTNDVAVLALDGADNILAVRILRSQVVPGTINAGAPIVLTAADNVTNQPVTIAGVPPGFSAPVLNASYVTPNGTVLSLNAASGLAYAAVSPADISALDRFQITTSALKASINETIGTTLFATNGTPVTLTYPPAWIYTPPAAAQFPTFSFTYSGFSGLATQTYRGQIAWQQTLSTTTNQLTVFASAAYLGTQTSVTIPNLAALPGFFGSAPSGTLISWLAEIDGGSFRSFMVPPPAPGSLSFVQARGAYTEP